MANARNKTVDTTFLSLDTAETRGFIHRDYIAHCLRWSHVIKRLGECKAFESARILDVGCGRELPLAKTLYSSRYIVQNYFGVDAGPILDESVNIFHSGKFPLDVWENHDICDITLSDLGDKPVNWVTCFEVLEHVEPKHMLRMLAHIRSLMSEDGTAFFSTPCWDVVSCAANHVNEMKYPALGAIFEREGWTIKNVHGTFASIREYIHEIEKNPALNLIYDNLRKYYDVNFLACIFAPMFPQYSRNCIWELSPVRKKNQPPIFAPITSVPTPWGSSHLWQDMGKSHEEHCK